MNKIIEYVNGNSVDEIANAVRNKQGLNVHKVINDLKQSRTEYGLKVQKIIEELQDEMVE